MKVCCRCKLEKDENEFYKDNRNKKDGLCCHCKDCDRISKGTKRKIIKINFDSGYIKCNKCGQEKTIDNFPKRRDTKEGYRKICRECSNFLLKYYREKNKNKLYNYQKQYREKNKESISEHQKQYREENKEVIAGKSKQYYEENKESRLEYGKQYRKKNKDKTKERQRNYVRIRRKNDIFYNLRSVVSNAITACLKKHKGQKNASIIRYLSYTIQQLKEHLESKFEPWMNWENYGKYEEGKQKWQIDHIIPQSKLPYDSMEHPNFKKCWVLENLRPLEVMENIKKGDKLL